MRKLMVAVRDRGAVVAEAAISAEAGNLPFQRAILAGPRGDIRGDSHFRDRSLPPEG